MRFAATIAIALLAASAARAATPDETFLAAAEACRSLSASSVANTAFIKGATPMAAEELNRMRLGHLSSIAMIYAMHNSDQASIDGEKTPVPVFQGWRVDTVSVVLMSAPSTTEFACSVVGDGDTFDTALAALEPTAGYGKPNRSFTLAGARVAAWAAEEGQMPRALLIGADFEGRKATMLQVSSK